MEAQKSVITILLANKSVYTRESQYNCSFLSSKSLIANN